MVVAVVTRPESDWARAMGAALLEALGQRSKKWLAREIGVDPATISRIINGRQAPSLDQLSKAADALGVTRRSLLARAGYLDSDGAATIDVDALPPMAKEMVLAMVGIARKGEDG